MSEKPEIDILEDVQPVITEDLSQLVQEVESLVAEIEDDQKLLDDKKKRLQFLKDNRIPEVMDNANLSEFVTLNGRKLTIKEIVNASIAKENKAAAYNWFEEQGHGDLIKHELSIQFGKGEDPTPYIGMFAGTGKKPVVEKSIHHSTLNAWVKEQLARGISLPEDLLGIYQGRTTVIKNG